MRFSFVKKDGDTATGDIFRWLLSAIDSIKDGKYIIDIMEAKKKRSSMQNALFHWWCRIISDDTGASERDVKDYFKTKFLMRDNTLGSGYIVGSTSDLSEEEFSKFLNEVHADASSEFACKLPTAEDKLYEQYFGKER